MELGTNKRPDYPKPGPEDEDMVIGNPRTTEPQKTWLDECAMMAMAAIIAKLPLDASPLGDGCEKEMRTARGAYSYADAMLAEKMKREAQS